MVLTEVTVANNNSTLQGPNSWPVQVYITTITAILSLLSSSVICITYIAWKDYRSTSRRILCYISVADFLLAVCFLFGTWRPDHEKSDLTCKIQACVSTCAYLWSLLWTTFLAVFMFTTVAKKQRRKAEIMLKFFHVFGWGIPLIIAGTAFKLDKFGSNYDILTPGWCFIDARLPRNDLQLWLWLTGISWDVAAYILVSVFYLMLKCHIRNQILHQKNLFPSQEIKNIALKADRMLTFVPIVFFLLRFCGTLRCIVCLYTDAVKTLPRWNKMLLYLQAFGDGSQGFANFLLFCVFTEQFQTRLRGSAQKLFVCCPLAIQRKLLDNSRYSGEETPMIESQSSLNGIHYNNYETCAE